MKRAVLLSALCLSGVALLAQQSLPVAVFPTDGETGVPLNAIVMVAWGCCPASFEQPFRLLRAGQSVEGRVTIGHRGRWVVFTPAASLAARTTY